MDVTPLVGARDVRVEEGLFTIVGSTVMLKTVFFPVPPLKAWGVEDGEQSLADCFPKCEGCCVCQCGSTTLPIICSCYFVVIINQHTHVIITNLQSHHPCPTCGSSSHACSYMIVLWDSWRRLMRSCVQVEDRCLPQRRTRRGARTEGAVPIAVSSIVVAVAALAVAADVFAIRGLQVAARTKAPPSARSGNSRPTSEPKVGVPAAYGSVGQGSGRSVPIEGQRCTQRGNRSGGRGRELAHGFFGGTELSTTSATRQRFGGTVIASYLHGHRQVIGTNLCPCAV